MLTQNYHPTQIYPAGFSHASFSVRILSLCSSPAESRGSNTLALVLGPLAGLILIVVTAFAIVKYRQLKRSGESLPLWAPKKLPVIGGFGF